MPASVASHPKRGDVYLADLDKPRPAIILSVDQLNRYALDVCIVPITTKHHAKFVLRVPLKKGEAGLDSDCWAKCDQVTTLEKTFLRSRPLGSLPPGRLREVEQQVKFALGLL
jgi:mRNA-degrading endonuclease toxin of MazEF toxin-antitoxin module